MALNARGIPGAGWKEPPPYTREQRTIVSFGFRRGFRRDTGTVL